MRHSDISVCHIYFVDFDPVRSCEFNGRHLSVVLKKNNDFHTFIVIPLTSSANGNGVNKYHLGSINSLPTNLRGNQTYAVFNQIRTVNASRFIALKEGDHFVDAKIDPINYQILLDYTISDLIKSINTDERRLLLRKAYERECCEKAKDIAYDMIKAVKSGSFDNSSLEAKKNEIKELVSGMKITLDQRYVDDGILEIINSALHNMGMESE